MRPDAYEPLTTERLQGLLEAGTPVFAFEADPLRDSRTPGLDPRHFAWRPETRIDLGELAGRLDVREPERFRGRSLAVYRASLSRDSGPTRSR